MKLFDWRSEMNIKSLLLGSAAALAVVSGAQAADAVVAAEPEPMEYVKVCDAYGTGFFYIPGTETCLKIGGQFRFEKAISKADGGPTDYSIWSRGRIEIEAKNDSEWGTVYSWIRFQGSHTNNLGGTDGVFDNVTDLSTAEHTHKSTQVDFYYYFGIGGLEFGRFDSPSIRFMGYGGVTDWGGSYADDWDRQYISYTADFGAAKAFISLDHDAVNGSLQGHKYMPDVSAGVKGTFGDYTAAAMLGYDESLESINVKAKLSGSMGMFGFALEGLYSDDAGNSYFAYDGFSVIAGISAKVTDTVTLYKDFQYWDDGSWRVIGEAGWAVAPGFSVLLQASYGDGDHLGSPVGEKVKTGMIRFERSF
jgi:hypothetical protein